MPSTVEELTNTRVKLTIEIPSSDLKPHLDKAYREIAKQVTIPGFRKGKIPPAVIDLHFGKGAVLQEAINEVLPEAYGKALQEQNIVPLGRPDIEVTELGETNEVTFTAEVDRRPDFTLADPSKIKVSVEELKPIEEEVDNRIAMLRERFATSADVERAAAEGDIVNVDLAGSKDGETLSDATADGVSFKIGNKAMMEGLDDAVIGLKAGESTTFTSTLVGGPLRGTECDVKVSVNKVQEQTLPELDDEFAAMVSKFDTVQEMRDDLTESVQRMVVMDQAANARDKALEELVTATELELPERVLADELASRHAEIEGQLRQMGLGLQEYLSEAEENQTEEEFWADIDKRAETALRAQLILDKAAEDREIQVSEADFSEHLYRRALQNGTSPEAEAQALMSHDGVSAFVAEIRRSLALNALMAEVEATDATGKKVDMSVLNPPRPEPQPAETEA